MTDHAIYLDLLHYGTPTSEGFRLGAAGFTAFANPHLRGELDFRGEYRWSVTEANGNRIASRGYSSLFGEWQSTVVGQPESLTVEFEESHSVPWLPGALFRIERRTPTGEHRVLFEHPLPHTLPARSELAVLDGCEQRVLSGTGPACLLFVSEGYDASERERFFSDAARAAGVLLRTSPFAEEAARLSFVGLYVPAARSGIPDQPGVDIHRTCFGSSYGTFGMARYLTASKLHELRRVTEGIAWSSLILLANSTHYGGSGVFNSNCCVATRMSAKDFEYVLPHELGHSLAGLGDEYFGKMVTYSHQEGVAPWEPNVSLLDGEHRPKWLSRLTQGVPLPTPWSHDEYQQILATIDSSAEPAGAASSASAQERLAELLAAERFRGAVGAFEGAHYQAKGIFRPEVDCRMFSRTATRFCSVCHDTIANALRGLAESC